MTALFENIFMTIFNMSVTGSIIIIAVIILRLLLKKTPKMYSYFLWYFPFFRLICPLSFSSFMSFFNLFDTSEIYSGKTFSFIPNDIVTPEIEQTVSNELTNITGTVSDIVTQAESSFRFAQLLPYIIVSVWIAGIILILAYSIFSHSGIKATTKTAVKLKDNIYECDNIPSPFVVGLFKPKIYIPFGLSEEEREYIVSHEKHHIIRHDHIKKSIAFLILAVHWFNPACWLGFVLMSRDMEMSCDEKVLEENHGIKRQYSASLLSFATGRRFPVPSPLTFSESGAEQRIKNALKWKEPKRWIVCVAVALCFISLFTLASNPNTDEINGREFYKRIEATELNKFFPEKSTLPQNAEIKYFDRDDGGLFPENQKVIRMRFNNEADYTKEKKKLYNKLFNLYMNNLGSVELDDGWKAVYVKDWIEAQNKYDTEHSYYVKNCCFGIENDSKLEIMYCWFDCMDQDYIDDFGAFAKYNYKFVIQKQTYEKLWFFNKDKEVNSETENVPLPRFDVSKITNIEDLVVYYRIIPQSAIFYAVYNKNGEVFFRSCSDFEPVVSKITDRVIKIECSIDEPEGTITETQYFDVYSSEVYDDFDIINEKNS